MIIVNEHFLEPRKNIESCIYTDKRLSEGAKVLYSYLYYRPIANLIDFKEIPDQLNISYQTFMSRKRELENMDLILFHKINSKLTLLFVGSMEIRATALMAMWEEENV